MPAAALVIAAENLISALRERVSVDGDIITFADTEPIQALQVIIEERPNLVVLERLFAATPRGAALINRIKADPALLQLEIRVVSHDGEPVRVPTRPHAETPPAAHQASVEAEAAQASAPLDQRGTRRAQRFRMAGAVGVLVDGNAGTLIDLSAIGAQVVSTSVLKPKQRVRIGLADDHGSLRFNAAVAWASFEIPPNSGPRYRAGIEFVDADAASVEGFCHRHKAS